jgi:hypothetical protein
MTIKTWLYYTAVPADRLTEKVAVATAEKTLAELAVDGLLADWTKWGIVIDPTGWEEGRAGEPNVIYEDNLFKMWYGGGFNVGNKIGYATALDGFNFTKHGAVHEEAGYFIARPFLVKWGSTYYLYYCRSETMFRVATSTDGINFTTQGTVLNKGGAGAWDGSYVGNLHILLDGGIYYMYYEALGGGGTWQLGLATSTDPLALFTKYGGNPIINRSPKSASHGHVVKIGTKYYMWLHGSPVGGGLPTDVLRRESTDRINWTNEKMVMTRTEPYEMSQVADQHLIEKEQAPPPPPIFGSIGTFGKGWGFRRWDIDSKRWE